MPATDPSVWEVLSSNISDLMPYFTTTPLTFTDPDFRRDTENWTSASSDVQPASAYSGPPAPSDGSFIQSVTASSKRGLLVPEGCIVNNQKFYYLPWDNPSSLVSLDTTFLVWKIISSSALPLLLTGVIVNVLNAIVFARLGLKERINFLLFCVAVADFLVVAYILPVAAELFVSVVRGKFEMFGDVVVTFANYNISWFYSFFYVSAFVTTMVSVDRCLCITHPFTAKRVLKTRSTVIVVAFVTASLVGGHYVVSDKYRIGCLYYPALGAALKTYHPSPFYQAHTQLVDVLNEAVYGVTLPAFYVITTSIATIITAVKLRSAASFRKDQGGQDKKEVAVTKMLVAVSCLFIACTIPNVVFRLLPLFMPDVSLGGRNQNMMTMFVAVIHLAAVINCSLNFFFYLKMGTKFRGELRRLCGACCSGRFRVPADSLKGSVYLTSSSSSANSGASQ